MLIILTLTFTVLSLCFCIIWIHTINKRLGALEYAFIILHQNLAHSDIITDSFNKSINSPLN
jgi:hypothetical protein